MKRLILLFFIFIVLVASTTVTNAALNIMPEYKGIEVDYKVLQQYEKLIKPLEPAAKEWLTETGLFLEDGNISWTERHILQALRGKKYQIWYITTPRMLDGVGLMDLAYVSLWNFRRDPALALESEMRELSYRRELHITPKTLVEFRKICRLGRREPQVSIGLSLIANLGKPIASLFKYRIPSYNTDLAVLGQVIGDGLDNKRVKPALAAAVVYGSIHTIGDKELRIFLPGYVRSMVQRSDLNASVADLMNLVWSAGGTHYPSYSGSKAKVITSWDQIYMNRPMKLKDFKWMFASSQLLDEISSMLKPKNEDDKLRILKDIHDHLSLQDVESAGSSVILYGGERFWGTHVMNPEYYWRRYQEGVTMLGDSLDRSQLEILVARALGLPATMGRMVIDRGRIDHSFTLVYNSSKSGLSGFFDDIDVRRKNNLTERIQLACDKIPWDNFRFDARTSDGVTRVMYLDTDEARVLGFGIPSAYLMKDRGAPLSIEKERKEEETSSKPVEALKAILHR